MNTIKNIPAIKIFVALLFVGVTHIALGSFTGSSDDKNKSLFSLKHFNKHFYKSVIPFSLRAGFQYKGIQVINKKSENGTSTINSVMRFEKGNATYIYPYKHRVSVPKFATPSAPSVR